MKTRSKLQIQQTVEELKQLQKQQTTVSGFEKVQALYLLQSGQVRTVIGNCLCFGKKSDNYSEMVE